MMSHFARALLLMVVITAMFAPVSLGQDTTVASPRLDPGKLASLTPRMKQLIARGEMAGAVTLVAGKNGVLDTETFGDSNLAEHRPMQADDLFWIASMTKPITATCIMMLQEEGKLSVDDPVTKYIPELAALKTPDGKPALVTLKHLLTHTSGMADLGPEEAASAHTLADLIPLFAKKPMLSAPGEKWRYCQSGINTLGRVIEVVSGQPLPDFFQNRIFNPLGMRDTTFYPTPAQAERLAASYNRNEEGKLQETPIRFLHGLAATDRNRVPAANGGLFSTAPDYARFARMILNGGSLDDKKYLTPQSVKMMTSVQTGDLVTGFTPGNGWGLGWCVVRQPQGTTAALSSGSFGHGGVYGTQAWIDPTKGLVYILMIQRGNIANSDGSEIRKVFQDTVADAITR